MTQQILKYVLDGYAVASWGTFGPFTGDLRDVCHLRIGSEDTLCVTEVFNVWAQKFRPQLGTDTSKLIREAPHSLSGE